jgi:hypothetical protein
LGIPVIDEAGLLELAQKTTELIDNSSGVD